MHVSHLHLADRCGYYHVTPQVMFCSAVLAYMHIRTTLLILPLKPEMTHCQDEQVKVPTHLETAAGMALVSKGQQTWLIQVCDLSLECKTD